jgi:glycine cleavage system H protein
MSFPENLRYTKDHEWARKDGDTITIGISSFAVEQLGDITLIDLPTVGQEVKSGEVFGTIESVKSVSDLYAAVAGKVTAVNEDLEDQPELVNESPYDKGWMVQLEASAAEFDAMLDAKAYAALVAEEE